MSDDLRERVETAALDADPCARHENRSNVSPQAALKYPRDPLPCPECGGAPVYRIVDSGLAGPSADMDVTYARRYECSNLALFFVLRRLLWWRRSLNIGCGPVAETHWMCDGWQDMALDRAAELWNAACDDWTRSLGKGAK